MIHIARNDDEKKVNVPGDIVNLLNLWSGNEPSFYGSNFRHTYFFQNDFNNKGHTKAECFGTDHRNVCKNDFFFAQSRNAPVYSRWG